MKSIEERLKGVDLAHTGHTIPYRMSRQEALLRMSVIDELKKSWCCI